ncbi:MAG: IS630 family transposase [Deltaproteobacteria bacterium]|nr:IS630 family transposase [Deltaproteobacteria bacterium]
MFADESGFLLVPSVLKTWAPRGCTPVLRHRTRRDKISVISAVSVSPQRRRLGLYYDFHSHNIRHQEVYAFLRQLLRHLRGHVVVLLDNAGIHTAAPLRRLCTRHARLHLEYFPAYAPELNPDEGVWAHTKRALANGRPDALTELVVDLLWSLEEVRADPALLRSCITQSDLPLFLP